MDRVKYYGHQSEQWKNANTADNNVWASSTLPSNWKKIE